METYLLEGPDAGRYQKRIGRWRFDATTRVLMGPYMTYVVDAQDRVLRRTENSSPQTIRSYTYDSNGHCTTIADGDGGREAVTYQNHYQDGRRVRVDMTSSGLNGTTPAMRADYRYDDPTSPLWTEQDVDVQSDGVVDLVWKRHPTGGLPTRIELRTGPAGTLDTVYTHQYEGGRLAVRQRDRGYWHGHVADGEMDLSMTWVYDAQGRLQTFEQDGVDSSDNPHIDGVADFREVYSLGCQALVARFPWIGNLPAADQFTFGDQPQ